MAQLVLVRRMHAIDLWGAVDVARWRDTPCLRGRVAEEQDVKDGRATFYLGNAQEIGARFEDIGLPHCAIFTDEDRRCYPVVIIQSERADPKHYIGYRFITGGNGVGVAPQFQLLDEPNELFTPNA